MGKIFNPFQGFLADTIAEQVIGALNLFFDIEIGETTTVGELLEDWLDVKLAGTTIVQVKGVCQLGGFSLSPKT